MLSDLEPRQRELATARRPSRVLTLQQFAELNALSLRTVKRLIHNGKGPRVIQLTDRRVGIREDDAAAWQAARLRGDA
jgi:predicted DNA-binding transcriptional regulator AlpA